MTTDITELALITKIKKQLENFDTVILKDDEALALVEALEKAQSKIIELQHGYEIDPRTHEIIDLQERIAELESRTVTDWIEHDGKWRPESLGLDELVYLKTRKQELKIPYPAGKVKGWMNTGGDMDVMAYKLASPQASTVTVKLPDDAEHDIMAPVAAYLSEKFKWDGSAARWDGRNEYDVLADRVKYALRMVIRRAAGIKVEVE